MASGSLSSFAIPEEVYMKSVLRIVSGDLLQLAEQGNFDIIMHGANCFTTFGSGIAKQIRKRYPTAYTADLMTMAADYDKLGTYTMAPSNLDPDKSKFVIVNAYTQYDFSRGKDVFEYIAFSLILQKLAHNFPTVRFGLPKIGCGLAGGNEKRIMSMIEEFAGVVDEAGGSVTVVEYAP